MLTISTSKCDTIIMLFFFGFIIQKAGLPYRITEGLSVTPGTIALNGSITSNRPWAWSSRNLRWS